METSSNPYLIKCPKCGASIEMSCQTASRYPSAVHSARWKAIGVNKPTMRQIGDAFDYYKSIERARLLALRLN